jgi:hypothetical protein
VAQFSNSFSSASSALAAVFPAFDGAIKMKKKLEFSIIK